MWSIVALALAVAPDSPRRLVLAPLDEGALPLVQAAAGEVPQSLLDARKLADSLRYEEAVVEYQRYLTLPERPARERAAALLEVGFIHLVLGDEATASARAIAALELEPALELAPSAPARQVDFLARLRREFLTRTRVRVEARREDDPPALVRATVADPEKKVKRVLLRHALSASGPFHSTAMVCVADACSGTIPPPQDSTDFTAWYYLEALDAEQGTLAKAASPEVPLQLAVVGGKRWYANPVVWGVGGVALVVIAGVVFLLSPAPPR